MSVYDPRGVGFAVPLEELGGQKYPAGHGNAVDDVVPAGQK